MSKNLTSMLSAGWLICNRATPLNWMTWTALSKPYNGLNQWYQYLLKVQKKVKCFQCLMAWDGFPSSQAEFLHPRALDMNSFYFVAMFKSVALPIIQLSHFQHKHVCQNCRMFLKQNIWQCWVFDDNAWMWRRIVTLSGVLLINFQKVHNL